MNCHSAETPESSSCSYKLFVKDLLNTFTTRAERKFWKQFQPLKKLGEGSFGSVVAATRIADNLPVAIKTVDIEDVHFVQLEGEEAYPREVIILHLLKKVKGVIGVVDCLETRDKVLIVLERNEDFIDLQTYIRQQRRPSEDTGRKIILQLVSIINNMMDLEILHRDIKPANILVNPKTLEIKLIDFGLISDVFSTNDVFKDRQGTRAYFPPELISRRRFFAGPGMVWVIGVIAFELLTGSRPFISDKEIIDGPLRIHHHLSRACKSFISSCLIRKVDSRLHLKSVADHPWLSLFTSLRHRMESLPEYSVDESDEEESPEFSELSFIRPSEEEMNANNPSSETRAIAVTPAEEHLIRQSSEEEPMSIEKADITEEGTVPVTCDDLEAAQALLCLWNNNQCN